MSILPKDELMEEIDNISHDEILRRDKKSKIIELNTQRDNELKGFIIDNIFLNKEIIKDMAVKFTTLADNEVAYWIDLDNKKVKLSKEALGGLVKKGTQKVEEIYFKYRALKDELKG